MSQDCIFCKIVNGDIPANLLYQDEHVVVFPDIQPQAQMHLLVVPKVHIASLADVLPEHEPIMGRMLAIANKLACENGSPEGCRVIVNNRIIGRQEVMHVHMHIMGGDQPLGRMLPKKTS